MQSTDFHAGAGSPVIILQSADGNIIDSSNLRRTATERFPRVLSRRSNRRKCHQRSASTLNVDMISPEEYEALPPSIQRKYFSPKERMYIAQQAATSLRKRQSSFKGSWLAPPTPTTPVRPSTSAGAPASSEMSQASMSTVSLMQFDEDVMTEAQARWFLSLPDKVRKQHFSRDEQVARMMRCKKMLEHVSPEMAANAYQHVLSISSDSRASSFATSRPSTAGRSVHDEVKSYFSSDTSSYAETNDADWEGEDSDDRSQLDMAGHVIACTVDDMNLATIPPPPPEPKGYISVSKPKRKSFIRRHSLTPLDLPAPTLAPPPVPALPSQDQIRYLALGAKQSRPSNECEDEPPVERRHYQDEDARTQLRKALSSTEKFDEALAFGFSPSKERNNSSSTTSSLPIQQPALYHSEHEDEDAHSIDTASPRTPTFPADDQTAIKQHSFDSGVSFSFSLSQMARPKTSSSAEATSKNREMTIHMTLTRRDLLNPSPKEQIYSVQRLQNTGVDIARSDPLALQPLSVTDDSTGAHGAFAVQHNNIPRRMKSVWKFLKKY